MSKFNNGKPELTLVYSSMLEGISRVRRFGIEKYGNSEDWRATASIAHYDAMLRHIFAHLEGHENDPESGLPHLYHAACNIMFEIEALYGGSHENIIRYSSSSGSLNQ